MEAHLDQIPIILVFSIIVIDPELARVELPPLISFDVIQTP